MTARELLIDSFAFDRWASLKWVETLERQLPLALDSAFIERIGQPFAIPLPPRGSAERRIGDIFVHLVWVHRIWLQRVGSDVNPGGSDVRGWIDALAQGWAAFLADADLDAVVEYRNLQGQPGRQPVLGIVRHTLDHATYHRGQIREIFEREIGDDFPDTSVVGYLLGQ